MPDLLPLTVGFCLVILMSASQPEKSPSAGQSKLNNGLIRHEIWIKHPGISVSEAVKQDLFEMVNQQDRSEEFYMNVETVVCGDAQCRLDTVRIYWTDLGIFSRLELPPDVALEKAEGKAFEQQDYRKLYTILANKDCSLKNVYKEEVVGSESTEGIDAVSGATIMLNRNDYIEGAVWTSYTLWHWVNGAAVPIIRKIAAAHFSAQELVEMLSTQETVRQIFALEEIIRRNLYEPEIIGAVREAAAAGNQQLAKLGIQYFEGAPASIFFQAMESLLRDCKPTQRLRYLKAISAYRPVPPDGFYTSLTALLYTWEDYPSIHSLLRVLEQKDVSAAPVLQNVVSLLGRQDFIIARSAYWFLQGKSLSPEQDRQLQAFYKKYHNRL